jgi:subtilisin family serine protease
MVVPPRRRGEDVAGTHSYQLGDCARKVDPKLRMIANGDMQVNVVRAERCSALAAAPQVDLGAMPFPAQRSTEDVPMAMLPPRGRLAAAVREIHAHVFLATDSMERLPQDVADESARVGSLATARVGLSQLRQLGDHLHVRSVSLGQPLKNPNPRVSRASVEEPAADERRVTNAKLHRDGQGVLVGIIDVQGFDFAHPDFLDAKGNTRFVQIWDQGATDETGARIDGGRCITKEEMDEVIAAAGQAGAPAVELVPQSQRVPASHGTHVASVAAGNRGVARNAALAGVLVSPGPEDADPRRSFYDSTLLARAVDHLFALGRKLGMPVSINISLGTNGHAHDTSAPINRWIDALLLVPGRSVCVAAGNAGRDEAQGPGDIGWTMGRIHTSGRIQATGSRNDIEWVVAGRGGRDFSENEMELWFSPLDRVAVSVCTPDGHWIGPIAPGAFIENMRLDDGSFFSVYNELYHAANGANYIGIYLSPNFKAEPLVGVRAGRWIVRLHGCQIRDGEYHGWIERDDPRELPPVPGVPEPLALPSFFSPASHVQGRSISTLACGQRTAAVANLQAAARRVHASSSQGPTRDGRCKPDVAAPGTDIVAACGFTGSARRWVAMTGTSMASPLVCGVVALMLAVDRTLSAAQIVGILQRTAQPLPGSGRSWSDDAGFGMLDAAACIHEAEAINQREDKTP